MSKITRLERMRFSILTNDLTTCYLCHKPKNNLHEVFYGRNRVNSMKWGCVAPLCYECHQGSKGVHNNHEVDIMLKQICQRKFMEVYPDVDFISIFHKSYI
jgi:hypothetical protein